MVLLVLTLLGAIGLFLYGLNLLSGGILKLTGNKLRSFLPLMKKNPVCSILAGTSITTIADSSSAATVMVVSFVNAGALTLAQAILVIMGANIGASFTTWIIAVFGFRLGITNFAYPFIAVGFILMMIKGHRRKIIGETILGFAFIFLGLSYMIKSFPAVESLGSLKIFIDSISGCGFSSIILFMAIGCLFAFGLQSTGAVTLTMIMLCSGWIGFDMATAMVMGENIGTTITANLAASDANIQAKRAAIVHTLFNVFGAIITLIFFRPFLNLITSMTEWLGISGFVPGAHSVCMAWNGVFAIAMFHTLFNLLNTCILAWFVKPIEKLVDILVKEQADETEKESRLKFISARHFSSPSISIIQATKEVAHFGEELYKGFEFVSKALNEADPDRFEEYRMNLVQIEEQSDKMEYEIAEFLNKVTTEPLTEDETAQVKVLYRVIGELESLGDCGENISRILERERIHNRKFDENAIANINLMISKTSKAYELMVDNLHKAVNGELTDITNTYKTEDDINETRNKLRNEGIDQIEKQTGNYQSLNYFLDIIAELETMGDFMINVSQSLLKKA